MMKQKIKRREYLGRIHAALLSLLVAGGCQTEEGNKGKDPRKESSIQEQLEMNRKMPADLVHKMLDQKVEGYMQRSCNCAQSSFLALEEQLGLDGDEVVKALTPLAGIAERGETCGAVTGPLMVFGMIYGRDRQHLDDWEAYRRSLVPAGKFCSRFETRFGSTMCSDIQQQKFGRCFRLMDQEELREFQESGATERCSEVVKAAVRMASDIILDEAQV